MMLLGKYNWWFPEPVRRALFVRPPKPVALETGTSPVAEPSAFGHSLHCGKWP